MKLRTWLTVAAILAGTQQELAAGADQPPPLRTEFAFEARVKVDKPMVIGESSHGLRRIVPILGGPVQGPMLKGNVIAGGADWQFVRPDGAWELQARYTVQTDDGVLILIENRGVRYGKPEIMERLAKGEKVDADQIYCRTVATFEAPRDSRYEWMNHTLFVGSVERLPDAAIVRFYKVH
ncbi:MAG TPA: DUF3237 domain-containing protein [Steroidobacteraceae bacterium]|nr:DUF3237 domain-containing protein [Steroidobacteraceae bacterium]